jgi:hypothetical protein
MTTPEGGWLGLVVEVGRQAKSEEEYEMNIARRLEELQADGRVWTVLLRYGWQEAKRAAFVAPKYRVMVERDLLKED